MGFAQKRLYLLVTRELCRRDPESVIRSAVSAGVEVVQLREPAATARDLIAWTRRVLELLDADDVPVLVNDRPDVALAAGADGVHLGQDDVDPLTARRILGPSALIGLSTHDEAQVLAAASQPVDYLGIGPLFDTETKGLLGLGPEVLGAAAGLARVPVFGIGGVTTRTVERVVRAGITRVAVCGTICSAEDPAAATAALRAALHAS